VYCSCLSWNTQQPVILFLCQFHFELTHQCYIQWLELLSAVRWEGIHDNAILSTIKYCLKCAVALMIVEKYQDGFFFAMASILLDLLQQLKKKKDLLSSHLFGI
jgi:hypothetical protein